MDNKIEYKFINSILLLMAVLLLIFLIKCNSNKRHYTDAQYDRALQLKNIAERNDSITKAKYHDDTMFLNGQLALQQNKVVASNLIINEQENKIDKLINKYKSYEKPKINDKDAVIVPNEFVQDCDTCFSLIEEYKNKNQQLRFERDSYDTLLKTQSEIDGNRITQLEDEKDNYKKIVSNCFEMRMQDSIRLEKKYRPKGILKWNLIGGVDIGGGIIKYPIGGGGIIYEDKRKNEYGINALGGKYGPFVLFNFAKKF